MNNNFAATTGAEPETAKRRDEITLDLNVPIEAALLYDQPLGPYRNRKGDRYMYTLETANGDKVIFVDAEVPPMIDRLGLTRGDRFRIGKFETRNGVRKGPLQWKVERVEAQNAQRPEPAPPEPRQQREADPAPNQTTGRPQATTATQTDTKAEPSNSKYGAIMFRCLVSALETAKQAEAHAAATSIPIRFTSQDIQGIASTFFIQAAHDGWLKFNGGSR